MPEEVKLSSYAVAKDYKSDYCSSVDDSHPESSIYADHSDREMSRSETSSCSDESSCYKQNGHESVEIIPTRTLKTSVPKPAANPLQFVKIGPCDLYRSAQIQIQKVSEVKKPKKEVKDEIAEDWQSNLDNWKCNRRKQQEHIIERVVEVKKLELEEHDRNRKRTKTFSEMMEERTSKGRKTSLPVFLEDDNDDLSDLGLSSNRSQNDSSPASEENNEDTDGVNGAHTNENCDDLDESKKSDYEATYESAIQSYETRMKSLTSSTSGDSKTSSTTSNVTAGKTNTSSATGLRKYGRRASATKIEEKLSELERIKNRSVSSTDLTESNKKSINIPKVNIFQRKEMFEKISDTNETNKNRRLSDEISGVCSIKQRLSSLGKSLEETTTPMTTTCATATTTKSKNILVPEVSVKDRLSLINRRINEHKATTVPEKSFNHERCSKLKMSSIDEAECGANPKEYETFVTGSSPASCKPEELLTTNGREYSSSERSSSSEDYEHVNQMNHFHHRSLDSLQGHDSPNGFCFERVQSLEFIDCCSNYPASVLSGDTDREDSGIHTADVSSSVSQADDFDLHADTSMDVDVKSQNATTLINDDVKVDKSSHSDFCFVNQDMENSLGEMREHVDITVVENENRKETSHAESNNAVNVSKEERTCAKEQLVEKNQKFNREDEGNGVQVENQNVDEESRIEDVSTSEDIWNASASRQNKDVFSGTSVDKNCWTTKGEFAKPENINKYVEGDLVEEEIIPIMNGELTNKSTQINQNFSKIEDDCNSRMEPNANSQNFDYMRVMNNAFIKENRNHNSVFAFEPSSVAAEPPKEKPPPPPPIDNSDEETDKIEKSNGLRRVDSTKRIKKEIRLKRSSFLGIEGYDDDSYLEPELEAVKPPPDMTTFLQEERRLEKLLYRQSICSESDSTQGESRDSGVELDKNHNEENLWMPEKPHSRQDSEIYANTSITSEEDEIIKKEREILEILELEEQRNYENGTKNECNYLGEKLVLKLKELENQKNANYWNQRDERPCGDDQCQPIKSQNYQNYDEQIMEQRHHQMTEPLNQSADSVLLQQQWAGRSLQDISKKEIAVTAVDNEQIKTRLDYRNSMPNIQQEVRQPTNNHHYKQPPPVPANKPTHFKVSPTTERISNPQQMSKQTLQALSAVPRSKIVATDSWVQTKKKPRQEAYNYQHWLIQEAEHRRITEYQQRLCKENVVHNYVNVHPEYSDATIPTEGSGLEGRATMQQQQHSNRIVSHPHPQMLPYRNQSQTYCNNNEYKSQTKAQFNNNSSSISNSNNSNGKPLPDSVIQTLTQRVQNRFTITDQAKQRKQRESYSNTTKQQEKILSVSGKKKCSHCGEELGRGAAMIIESLRLFYHIDCFRCCVCCVQLGDGLMGTDVRVRNSKLHCHSCYSNDEGLKFSCV